MAVGLQFGPCLRLHFWCSPSAAKLLGVLAMYGLRGFGYPLFAYGFLVWISVAVPRSGWATAVGWFGSP